jgi:hypothetical protein
LVDLVEGAGNIAHVLGGAAHFVGGNFHVGRYVSGDRTLFLDGCGDGCGNAVDLANGGGNTLGGLYSV